MILSLDTTSEFGSVALTDESGTIDEAPIHAPDGFGQVLFGVIQKLLARHGLDVNEIECFSAASGPGSFTGVRIGLAAVKGLGEATGRPVAGVSNLQAMAAFGSAPLRATVLDARRGEIYGAVYDRDLRIVQPETVMKFPAWLANLPKADIEMIALDSTTFGDAVTIAPRALAGAIGRIALRRLLARETCDPAAIDANYVRRADAELLWRE